MSHQPGSVKVIQRRERRSAAVPGHRAAVRALAAALLALLIASGAGAQSAGAPAYTIVNLDAFGPAGQSGNFTPNAINATGALAGFANGWWNADAHAALFDAAGVHDLGALPYNNPNVIVGDISGALGLNDGGQVVGYSNSPDNTVSHAFLYTGGSMHDLGVVTGNSSVAVAISNFGQIVGRSGSTGVLWANGTATQLGSFTPAAINDVGQVAGVLPSGHAGIWQNGTVHDIGVLPGYSNSAVTGINATGQVVGASISLLQPSGRTSHAFFYDGSAMHDLGTLGGSQSLAQGIDAAGQIVGWAYTSANTSQTRHAFLVSGGVMTDLNDRLPANSGWVLWEAHAINDAGQIAGIGTLNGQYHGFLMTPGVDPRTVPPTAPSGLSVQMVSTSELDLTWNDNSNNETSFEVQVEDPGNLTQPWRGIGTVPANTTTFASTGLQSYTHYTFRVRAVNAAGASAWSIEAGGDTGLRPVAAISADRGLDFGSQLVGTTSSAQAVTVTNEGTGPLDIQSITVTGSDAREFALVPAVTTPRTLAPGASLSMSLVFTPAARGLRTATVTLADNEPLGAATFGLSGTGIAPVAQISPGSLDFGRQPIGTGSTLALLLQNTGDAPLAVKSVSLAGTDPDDFTVAADGWTGAQLQPGQTASLSLRFTPTAAGDRSASLVVLDNAVGGQQIVTLTGTGTAPVATLSATRLTFTDQPVGTISAEQTLTLTNTGTAPLAIGTLTLSGANADDFLASLDPEGLALAPGASRLIRVRFRPTAAGSRSATLRVTDSAADSPQAIILSGNGTAPSISFGISELAGPGSLSFGTQALGTSSAAQSLTLTNSGTAPLVISSLSLGGADPGDYQMVSDSGGATLAPGTTRTLALRFTPQAMGSRAASLTINDNAGSGQQTIGLSGSGMMPVARHPGLVLPTGAELQVITVNGAPLAPGARAIVSVGQPVALKLLVKFPDGVAADVTTDPSSRFASFPPRGRWTGPGTWTPQRADAGKTVTLTGTWVLLHSGKRWRGMVTVTVRARRG